MAERRSTRARTAREEAEAAAAAEPPKETPSKAVKQAAKKGGKSSTKNAQNKKRKLASETPHESVPGTPAGELALEPVKLLLPVRLIDGQPLPTLPEPQATDLSSTDYQSIQQSGVLSASLQRSRATWTSGANFQTFCTKFVPPRLVKNRTKEDNLAVERQNEIKKNVPLVGSGNATLIVEPHTFPIQFFASKEPARSVQKQKQVYGQWPQSQYPSYQSYNHTPTPQYPRPTVQQPPNPPKPPPPPKQTHPHPPAPPAPPAPTTPAPDPVIHMLAQRAGSDPQLKAVMKIVAAGQATKEQLEFFQGHINELSEILQKQKAQAKMVPPPAPPPPPPPPPVPPPQPAPIAAPPAAPALVSGPQTPNPQRAYTPAQGSSAQGAVRPSQPPQPPYSPYTANQPHMSPYPPVTQPPKPSFRPLVFEFTEGNGDKFHFPSYSFLEWLPGGRAVKLSFLITKMKPTVKEKSPAPPAAPSTPAAAAPATSSTAPTAPMANNTVATTGTPANPATELKVDGANPTITPANPATPAPPPTQQPAKPHASPGVTAPKPEDLDEKDSIKNIEFYQPITVIIASHDNEVLQALPRAVRPPDVVEKYMNEVFDTCKRADETYLAFRLPKEGTDDAEDRRSRAQGSITPATPGMELTLPEKKRVARLGSATPVAVGADKKVAGRGRKSIVELGKG